NTSRPHPLTPSPAGEGELNLLLPSPTGRGAGGEGETFQPDGFQVKLTPLSLSTLPLIFLIPSPQSHFIISIN
ncbi:hypothetical protein FDUTEX481_06848, partial [Tolypothrix sp. PCC 7601]